MKYTSLLINGALLISVCLSIDLYGQHESMDLKGAWQRGPEENRIVWINSEKHFSAAVYNSKENIFLGTSGGTWKLEGNTLVEVHEFNTIDPDLIGKEIRNEVKMSQGKLVITEKDKE
ncbi:MAG: hypothetical protein OEV24_10630, partial [Cyclobacteriaceae bacterium]|nr:hypothetical protein [Cyclobacteriaceae bacterium]